MHCRKYQLHNCNRNSHLHNYNKNYHPHLSSRKCDLHMCSRNLNCITATETVTYLIATERSCMAKSKDWRSENANGIELNCKVVNIVATSPPSPAPPPPPNSTSTPPFQVYTPILPKNFIPHPSNSIFGRFYPPSPGWGGGVQLCKVLFPCEYP